MTKNSEWLLGGNAHSPAKPAQISALFHYPIIAGGCSGRENKIKEKPQPSSFYGLARLWFKLNLGVPKHIRFMQLSVQPFPVHPAPACSSPFLQGFPPSDNATYIFFFFLKMLFLPFPNRKDIGGILLNPRSAFWAAR